MSKDHRSVVLETDMNPDRLEYFKKKLEKLATSLEEALRQGRASTDVVSLDTAIGRLSRMDAMQSQQMALELQRRQQNELLRVQNALKRFKRGTYGLCGKCKCPIDEDRLEAKPDAALCVACADMR